jgi:protein SCO1/2
MNLRAARPHPLLSSIVALLLLLGAAACQRAVEEPPLKGATIGGPFSLTDQDGRRVTDAQFNGRYRLIYFGFANCPDVCPVDLAVAGAGLRQFEQASPDRAAKVQPIFITVDPAHDTPAVLKAFVANFHPRLIGLTGSREEIGPVLKAYGGSALPDEPAAGGAYNVNHSRVLLLMGPQGEPIAIVPHDQGAQGVAAELDRWVR